MESAHLNLRVCCQTCRLASGWCPICGATLELQLPAGVSTFPFRLTLPGPRPCWSCRSPISMVAVGWRLNPTGERPAAEVLSDRLPALERALAAEPAEPKNPLLLVQPAPERWQQGDYLLDNFRMPLRSWVAELGTHASMEDARIGRLVEHLTPSAIAALYRRLYQREPKKRQQITVYTSWELVGMWEAYSEALAAVRQEVA